MLTNTSQSSLEQGRYDENKICFESFKFVGRTI